MTPVKTNERLNEHSRQIKLINEFYVPMARTAMEIVAGKNGEPGMAENLRILLGKVETLITDKEQNQTRLQVVEGKVIQAINDVESLRKSQDVRKDIYLMGMRVSSDTRTAIIGGLFVLLNGVVTYMVSK